MTSLVGASAGLRDGLDCLALISSIVPPHINVFMKKSLFAMTIGGMFTEPNKAVKCMIRLLCTAMLFVSRCESNSTGARSCCLLASYLAVLAL